jgi:hypothetical protein
LTAVQTEIGRIERRVQRLNRTVSAPAADQITLLRSARILKRTHDELSRVVMLRAREEGRVSHIRMAEHTLLNMDRELRRALLEYSQLSRGEMATCLREAASMALSVAETLKTAAIS